MNSNDIINGLVQDCSISIADVLEILQSCAKPSEHCLGGTDIHSGDPYDWFILLTLCSVIYHLSEQLISYVYNVFKDILTEGEFEGK